MIGCVEVVAISTDGVSDTEKVVRDYSQNDKAINGASHVVLFLRNAHSLVVEIVNRNH